MISRNLTIFPAIFLLETRDKSQKKTLNIRWAHWKIWAPVDQKSYRVEYLDGPNLANHRPWSQANLTSPLKHHILP
jgi:hypothetical protein